MAMTKTDELQDLLKVTKIDADPFESIEASIRRLNEANEPGDSSRYVSEWELHEEAIQYGEQMAALIKDDELLQYGSTIETSIFDDNSSLPEYQGEMSTSSFDGTLDRLN